MTATALADWARTTLLSARNAVFYGAGVFTGVLLVYPPGQTGFAEALTLTTVVFGSMLFFTAGLGIGLLLMHGAHVFAESLSDGG